MDLTVLGLIISFFLTLLSLISPSRHCFCFLNSFVLFKIFIMEQYFFFYSLTFCIYIPNSLSLSPSFSLALSDGGAKRGAFQPNHPFIGLGMALHWILESRQSEGGVLNWPPSHQPGNRRLNLRIGIHSHTQQIRTHDHTQ